MPLELNLIIKLITILEIRRESYVGCSVSFVIISVSYADVSLVNSLVEFGQPTGCIGSAWVGFSQSLGCAGLVPCCHWRPLARIIFRMENIVSLGVAISGLALGYGQYLIQLIRS